MPTTELTTEQRNILRSKNKFSKIFMAIHNPEQVFCCSVTTFPESSDKIYEIEYDSEISGNRDNVISGMTCWIGTAEGLYDLGIVRARKIPDATKVYLGENSDIHWHEFTGTIYITIVDEFSIWARHPRLLADGTFYMDYDIEYSNQHTNFLPVVNMGTHAVAWLEGSSVDVSFDASNSWCFVSGTKTYLWECTGGTIDDDEAENPVITFSETGTFRVSCTVTVDGVSRTSYRYVFIYSKENPPLSQDGKMTFSGLNGSYEEGGWSFNASIHKPYASDLNVRKNALVILFSLDYYNNELHSIGAETGRENILTVGYITEEDFYISPDLQYSKFTVKSANQLMSSTQGFTDGIESIASASNGWTNIRRLNVDKAIWHLLEWRSTCLNCFDWYKTGDSRQIFEAITGEAKLYDQISIQLEGILAKSCFDKYGKFYTEIEQQFVPVSERTAFPEITLEQIDIKGKVAVKRFRMTQNSMLILSGVWFEQGISPKAFFSLSPGHVFKRFGDVNTIENIAAFPTQAENNMLAGLMLGFHNHEFEFEIDLTSNNRMIDICPRQRIAIDITEDSPNEAYAGNVIVRGITYIEDNEESGYGYYNLVGENETFPENAVDGDIPTIDDFDFSIPNDFEIPGMPDFPFLFPTPTFPPYSELPPNGIIIHSNNLGVMYTENGGINWNFMNFGLDDDATEIKKIIITPNGSIWALASWARIYRATALGGDFELVSTGLNYGVLSLDFNPEAEEEVYATIRATPESFGATTSLIYKSTGGSFSALTAVRFTSAHNTLFTVLPYNGKIYWFGSFNAAGDPEVHVYNSSGGYINGANLSITPFQLLRHHKALALPDKIYNYFGIGQAFLDPDSLVVTGDLTFSPFGSNALNLAQQAIAFSPTGNIAMGAAEDASLPVSKKTTDGSVTWEDAGALVADVANWENCGDDFRWLLAGGSQVEFTFDAGETSIDITGDMADNAPDINIVGIRMVHL